MSMPLRVLHVIPAVAPRYGGPSRVIFEMGQALQERGVEIVVATTDADGPGRLPVEIGAPVAYQGVRTVFFRRQWSEAYKLSLPLARWLNGNVGKFDLVHIHAVFSHACLAAASASQRQGVPYVVRPLGTLDPWSMRQKRFRKTAFWTLGVKRMLHEAAGIHYTALDEQRLAETSLGLGRGVVVPLGVSDDLLRQAERGDEGQPPPPAPQPYVLVLCRLHPKKGIELFLQAFADVVARGGLDEWRVVLAGDGDAAYVAHLKQVAAAAGLSDRVTFAGWLDGEQKVAALRAAALMALPSHQENFALSVAEALAFGVPSLISEHVNIAAEVQRAQAGWVTPLDRTTMARLLEEAMRDGPERAARGAAGRALLEARFTWPAVAAKLAQVYASLARPAQPE